MASLLAVGAGAANGFETLLQNLALEHEQALRDRAQAELERHNKSEEDLRGRQQGMLEQERQDALKEKDQTRQDKLVSERGIGDEVSPEEMQRETAAGQTSALYDQQPARTVKDLTGFSTLPGMKSSMSGQQDQSATAGPQAGQTRTTPEPNNSMNAPGLIKFRGTSGQRRQAAVDAQNADVANTKLDIGYQQLQNMADKLQMQGKLQEAQMARLLAEAARDRALAANGGSASDPLVNIGGEMIPRSEALKRHQAGESLPAPLTGASKTMAEGAAALRPHIQSLGNMATELDKRGQFGPIAGRLRQYLTKYGSMLSSDDVDTQQQGMIQLGQAIASDPQLSNDRLAGKFATSLGLLMTGAARVHGGARGGGSPQMLAHFKTLLGDSASLPMFLGKLDALDEFMAGYQNMGKQPTGTSPTTPSVGDIYEEYLKRTQGKKPGV